MLCLPKDGLLLGEGKKKLTVKRPVLCPSSSLGNFLQGLCSSEKMMEGLDQKVKVPGTLESPKVHTSREKWFRGRKCLHSLCWTENVKTGFREHWELRRSEAANGASHQLLL